MTQPYLSVTRISGVVRDNLMESAHLKITMAQDQGKIIGTVVKLICNLIDQDHTIFIFGNGGSAADAQHFVGELVGMCKNKRKPLPAIALSTNSSILTAVSNDFGFSAVFARQIEALGKEEDLAIGISTSGNSENILKGLEMANELGLATVALTGNDGGRLGVEADLSIIVPSNDVLRIQEVHITILHIIAEIIEGYYCRGASKA